MTCLTAGRLLPVRHYAKDINSLFHYHHLELIRHTHIQVVITHCDVVKRKKIIKNDAC